MRSTEPESRNLEVVSLAWMGGILLVAGWLRFHDLGALPLSPAEAVESYRAWAPAAGEVSGPVVGDSTGPLLVHLQTWIFFVLGSSELMARVLSALAGTALVAGAWLWRPLLGRFGALTLALLLALDPFLIAAARRAGPQSLAIGLGFFVIFRIFVPSSRGPRSEVLLAVCIGLLLMTGFLGWTFLAVALGCGLWIGSSVLGTIRLWSWVTLTVGLVAGGLWCFWSVNPTLGSGFESWLASLSGVRSWPEAPRALSLLLAKEPLLLAAVVTGFTLLARHRDDLARDSLRWLMVGGGLLCLVPSAVGSALVVLPAALLGSWGVATLFRVQPGRQLRSLGVLLVVVTICLQLRNNLHSSGPRGLGPWTLDAPDPGARELVAILDQLVLEQPQTAIAVVADPWVDPVVAWSLRDRSVSWVPSLPATAPVGRRLFIARSSGDLLSGYESRSFVVGWSRSPDDPFADLQPVIIDLWEPAS
ncbi:MAG: hypothetical protein K8J08_04305 [Thermoanaerobaculia bacterium]|nr:hypothetical protein [Thermoanaerobaculia bacterium]